jgi:hypothetical protein
MAKKFLLELGAQFGLVDKNAAPVWNTPFIFDDTPGFIQGVGDVDNDGDLDLLSPGHPISPGVDTTSLFHAYDAATGQLLWQVNLPGRAHAPVGGAYHDTPTLSVSADIDSDGRVESVFAIADTLYAVGADPGGTSGQIEWTFKPDSGLLGSPIIADGNGDGQAEIIVVSTSGFVYGIGAVPGELVAASLVTNEVTESTTQVLESEIQRETYAGLVSSVMLKRVKDQAQIGLAGTHRLRHSDAQTLSAGEMLSEPYTRRKTLASSQQFVHEQSAVRDVVFTERDGYRRTIQQDTRGAVAHPIPGYNLLDRIWSEIDNWPFEGIFGRYPY